MISLFDTTSLLDLLGFFFNSKAYSSVGHLLTRWIPFNLSHAKTTFYTHFKQSLGRTIKRCLLCNHLPQNTLNCCFLRPVNTSLGLILTPTKTTVKFIEWQCLDLFHFLCQAILFSITFNLTSHVLMRIAKFLLAFWF